MTMLVNNRFAYIRAYTSPVCSFSFIKLKFLNQHTGRYEVVGSDTTSTKSWGGAILVYSNSSKLN